MTTNKITLFIISLVVLFGGYFLYRSMTTPPAKTQTTDSYSTTPVPTVKINPTAVATASATQKKSMYTALLKTTAGDITIELSAATPKTSANFITLAKKGFYDKTIFHRTIKGFMIQGGDPQGTGMGGPGYKFDDEPFTGQYLKGTVAMANSGPNTNGSQFFIMHADYPLPKNYTIFGQVTQGLEVVDKIATAPTQTGGEGSRPVTPVTINSVTVTEK